MQINIHVNYLKINTEHRLMKNQTRPKSHADCIEHFTNQTIETKSNKLTCKLRSTKELANANQHSS